MSRARYHSMEGSPNAHQEQPVGGGSSRKPRKETQVLGAAFPNAGRQAAEEIRRENDMMVIPKIDFKAAEERRRANPSLPLRRRVGVEKERLDDLDRLNAMREKLGVGRDETLGDDETRVSGDVLQIGRGVEGKNTDFSPADLDKYTKPKSDYEREFELQRQQLTKLEAHIQNSFGHTAYELDKDPNLINKNKGAGARLKGWLYAQAGKSSDGLLDIQLSQWRNLKKEIVRKEQEMEEPLSSRSPAERDRSLMKVRYQREVGDLSAAELNTVLDQKNQERLDANAYRRDNYRGAANADETFRKGQIAVKAGNVERANALADALTEQAFFDDGLTLEGAAPKIKRESERAQAIAQARNERVRKDGASQEDYDELHPDQFNALLAENMASQKELEDGALPPPYARPLARRRVNQYSGGADVSQVFDRIGANQLLGRPVVEAPRSTVEAQFKSLLDGSERMLGYAKKAYDEKLVPTEAMLNKYKQEVAKLADERSRLADTPGFDKTPQYAKAMELYREMVHVGVALEDRLKAEKPVSRVSAQKEKQEAPPADPSSSSKRKSRSEAPPHEALAQVQEWILNRTDIWIKRSSGEMQKAKVAYVIPGEDSAMVHFTDPATGREAQRKYSFGDLIRFQEQAPRVAPVEKREPMSDRQQEVLSKEEREALANLEASLGTSEAKRIYDEVMERLIVSEGDLKGMSAAAAEVVRSGVATRVQELAAMFRVQNASVLHAAVVQKYMALVQQNRRLSTELLRKQLAKANGFLGFTAQHNLIAPEAVPPVAGSGEDDLEALESAEAMAERFEGAIATRPSSKHKTWNEDSSIANDSEQLYAVLDGVGGQDGGEFASSFVKRAIEQNAVFLSQDDPMDVKRAMEQLLKGVSADLLAEGRVRGLENPATTCSLVKIIENIDGKRTAIVGTVGDSRTYVRGSNGSVKFASEDQSFGYVYRKLGKISSEQARQFSDILSNVASKQELARVIAQYPELEEFYTKRNAIAQGMGMEAGINPEVVTVDLEPGDEVIITTDGVHDNLTDKEIQQILAMDGTAQEIANMLVAKAYERSQDRAHMRHKPDDITAVVASGPARKVVKAKKPAAAPRKAAKATPPPVPDNAKAIPLTRKKTGT